MSTAAAGSALDKLVRELEAIVGKVDTPIVHVYGTHIIMFLIVNGCCAIATLAAAMFVWHRKRKTRRLLDWVEKIFQHNAQLVKEAAINPAIIAKIKTKLPVHEVTLANQVEHELTKVALGLHRLSHVLALNIDNSDVEENDEFDAIFSLYLRRLHDLGAAHSYSMPPSPSDLKEYMDRQTVRRGDGMVIYEGMTIPEDIYNALEIHSHRRRKHKAHHGSNEEQVRPLLPFLQAKRPIENDFSVRQEFAVDVYDVKTGRSVHQDVFKQKIKTEQSASVTQSTKTESGRRGKEQ